MASRECTSGPVTMAPPRRSGRRFGFKSTFETDHGSGQWAHPAGGPYVFIREQHDAELVIRPVLGVADSVAFAPEREPDLRAGLRRQHWGVVEALLRDPDGRTVSLEAPLPPRRHTASDAHDRQEEVEG